MTEVFPWINAILLTASALSLWYLLRERKQLLKEKTVLREAYITSQERIRKLLDLASLEDERKDTDGE